jgi:hypothetical protein
MCTSRRTHGSGIASLVLLLLLAPTAGQAGPKDSPQKSFRGFCAEWMKKLEHRQHENMRKATPVKAGDRFVLEYTGYDRKPVSCEANPGSSIGRLVYHELKLRRTGATPAAIDKSEPGVVREIEVMEIFRHDGSRWQY